MRIPIGTVCLTIYAPARPDLLGKTCVVAKRIPKDPVGHNLLADYNGEAGVAAADKCLKPLTGDNGANFSFGSIKKPRKKPSRVF